LAGTIQPTFVAVGDNDTMMHTKNSHLLAERLPNAHLRIYPDANHGFLNQYPELSPITSERSSMQCEDQTAESSFAIGGDLPVRRFGFGTMQLPGPGVWGEPRDHGEAIPRTSRVAHLEENIAAADIARTPEQIQRLDAAT
jgi:hypothetical protein